MLSAARWVQEWWRFVFCPSGAFWGIAGARPCLTITGVVSCRVRLSLCGRHHGRSFATLLRAVCQFGFGCPPVCWTPAAVPEGSVGQFPFSGCSDCRGTAGGG